MLGPQFSWAQQPLASMVSSICTSRSIDTISWFRFNLLAMENFEPWNAYAGTSEISSFDESSPSGNDYLAEVRVRWTSIPWMNAWSMCEPVRQWLIFALHLQVCREWEARACQVNQEDVRLVLLRIGVVLGKDGGALGTNIYCLLICFAICLLFLQLSDRSIQLYHFFCWDDFCSLIW